MGIFSWFTSKFKSTPTPEPIQKLSKENLDHLTDFSDGGLVVRDYGLQSRNFREALEVLQEAAPTMPGLGLFVNQITGYRAMNRSIRDMNEAARLNLSIRCENASVINPMGLRGMNMRTDMIVSEGFKVESTAKLKENREAVQAVIDSHWELNSHEEKMFSRVMDLGVMGEMVSRLPPLDEPMNHLGSTVRTLGICRLGLVIPHLIRRCVLSPWNYENIDTIYMQEATYPGMETLTNSDNLAMKVVRDQRIDANEFGSISGEIFYTNVNCRPGCTRGISDMASIVDFLDWHDRTFASNIERAEQMRTFIWDVTLQDASHKQVAEFLKKMKASGPAPGSVRAHNQKEIWDAVSPDLKVSEGNELQEALFKHVWGAFGLPFHWWTEGGDTNRACHSEDTETLTIDGWKKFHELSEDSILATVNPDTGAIEYFKADKFLVYDYTGKMVHFDTRDFDVLVTPEHVMWAERFRNDKNKMSYERIQAKDMLESGRFNMLLTGEWTGGVDDDFTLPSVSCHTGRAVYPEITIPGDLWAEFLGYVISEGHIRRKKIGEYLVTICQKKEKGVRLMRECVNKLNSLGFRFKESQKSDGTYVWSICDKALNLWLAENCGALGAKSKKIPAIAWGWTKRRLEILLEALVEGDGSKSQRSSTNRRGCVYYTSSKQLEDDIQRLCCLIGMSSKKRTGTRVEAIQILDHRESQIGPVKQRKESKRNILNKKNPEYGIKEVEYSGKVYCFEVKNHFFITRRNGKTVVSHNTSDNMTDPFFAWARTRKRLISQRLLLEFRYAVQIAYMAGRLPNIPTEELGVRVISRDPDRKGYEGVGSAWKDVADSLNVLTQSQLVDTTSAANIVRVVLGSYGFEIDKELLENEVKNKDKEKQKQQMQMQQSGLVDQFGNPLQQTQAPGVPGQPGQIPGQQAPQVPQYVTGKGKGVMNSSNALDAVMNEGMKWLEQAKREERELPKQF